MNNYKYNDNKKRMHADLTSKYMYLDKFEK